MRSYEVNFKKFKRIYISSDDFEIKQKIIEINRAIKKSISIFHKPLLCFFWLPTKEFSHNMHSSYKILYEWKPLNYIKSCHKSKRDDNDSIK